MIEGEVQSFDRIREILIGARTVAVLGASTTSERPGFYVPDYLHQQGYRIIPVNPLHRDTLAWGEPFRAKLTDIIEPVDIVSVFRHPNFLPSHTPELLAMQPPPKVVWFQQGIRNDEVAAELVEAGIEVVQDRCALIDHGRLERRPV